MATHSSTNQAWHKATTSIETTKPQAYRLNIILVTSQQLKGMKNEQIYEYQQNHTHYLTTNEPLDVIVLLCYSIVLIVCVLQSSF